MSFKMFRNVLCWDNKYLTSIQLVLIREGIKEQSINLDIIYFHRYYRMISSFSSDEFEDGSSSQTSHGYLNGKSNGYNEAMNGSMSKEFFQREFNIGVKTSQKIFDPDNFLNGIVFAGAHELIKKHNQLLFGKNQNQSKSQKLLGQKNQLVIDNILLKSDKENLQEKYQRKITQLNQIKKQIQRDKQENNQKIKDLRSQLKTASEKIQKLQNQVKQKNQQIKSQHNALHEKVNTLMGKQNNKQLNFEDLLNSVEKLGQQLKTKIAQYNVEKQFVFEDFEKVISNFKQVPVEDLTYPKFGRNGMSFFSKTIESLKRNRLQKQDELKVPIYYEKFIELISLVDEKNERIISDWNVKLNAANGKIKRFQDEVDRLRNLLDQKDIQYKKLQAEFSKVKKDFQDQIIKLQKEIKNLLNKISQLQGEIRNLEKVIEKLKKDSQIKVDEFNKQLKAKQDQLKQKKQQIIQLTNTINQLKKTIKQLNDKIKLHQTTIADQSNQIKRLKQKISSLQNQLRNERLTGSANSNKASQELRRLEQTKTQLQQKINQLQRMNLQTQGQKQEIQKTLVTKNQQLQRQQKQNYDLKQREKEMLQIIAELQMKPKFVRCYQQYFNGKILNEKNSQKTELFVNHIEAEMGRKIIGTRLLYRDDRYNNNSFHNYVDGIPNIVLLVIHNKGKIIGGFSEAAYHKTNFDCDFKKGLMVQFNNGRVYHTKQQREGARGSKTISRPLSYDEFYIIWGNSDLRIKPPTPQARKNDLELHTFYKAANSCYEERGNPDSSYEDLVNENSRTLTYEGFQLFEVIFE